MRGRSTENHKDTHVTVRLPKEDVEYLDAVGEEWGLVKDGGDVNRSETLRTIIKTHSGLLYGNFFGIVDNDRLASEWGSVGHTLAAANESDRGVPTGLQEARLVDVIGPVPLLVSAAETELEGVNGDGDD